MSLLEMEVRCPECDELMEESLATMVPVYENEWKETSYYHCEQCGRDDVIENVWELRSRRRWRRVDQDTGRRNVETNRD